jgi:hypothetical protein
VIEADLCAELAHAAREEGLVAARGIEQVPRAAAPHEGAEQPARREDERKAEHAEL